MVKGHVVSLAGVGHVFFFHADNVGYFLQPLRFPCHFCVALAPLRAVAVGASNRMID